MTITVATWNIQNFRKNDPVYRQKLDYLSCTIQSLGSDVVALQEVLDAAPLYDLAAELYFQYFIADPDCRGNRVAFLTCNPPTQHQQIVQWQLPANTIIQRFDSDCNIEIFDKSPCPAYQVTVSHGNHGIDIITAHLKSKLLTFSGNFSTSDETLQAQTAVFALKLRVAEATTLREHVSDLLDNCCRVVVFGDFNEGPEAATTQILYGSPSSQPKGLDDADRAICAFEKKR